MKINVLYIPLVGAAEERQIENPTHTRLSEMVGGYLELHTLWSGEDLSVGMMINEDGKGFGLPTNNRATLVAEHYQHGFLLFDRIVGNAVVVGYGSDGETVSLPSDIAHDIRDIWEKVYRDAGPAS